MYTPHPRGPALVALQGSTHAVMKAVVMSSASPSTVVAVRFWLASTFVVPCTAKKLCYNVLGTTTWVAVKNEVAPGIRTREGSNPQGFDKGVEAMY